MHVGVHFALRNRLTAAASLQLSSLLPLLQVFQLNALPHARTMLDGQPFCTRATYSSLHEANTNSDSDLINASPVPDGFGPGFYRKFWPHLKTKIQRLFQQFYTQSLDTSSINRAYLIFLPKKDGARTPAQFRPISLQNCPIKAIAKLLANRIQNFIPQLIHGDHTGFVSV
jgi:hypothetical protein